jgi:hypothetical protein
MKNLVCAITLVAVIFFLTICCITIFGAITLAIIGMEESLRKTIMTLAAGVAK